MEKGPAFVVAAFMLGCSATIVAACSDDGGSTFNEGTPDAASDGPTGSFNVDSGNGGDGALPGDAEPGAKCEPVIPDDYQPAWNKPTKATACAAEDLAGYYEECLGNITDAGAAGACDAWKGAHATCSQCIETADNSGPIQWYQQRYYYTLNVAGCIAIKQDKYEATDCGGAYNAAITCERDACAGCFKTNTSSFADFRACQNAASMVGMCKSLETQQGTTCSGVKTDPATATCFKETSEDTKTFFTRVMGIFCGP